MIRLLILVADRITGCAALTIRLAELEQRNAQLWAAVNALGARVDGCEEGVADCEALVREWYGVTPAKDDA